LKAGLFRAVDLDVTCAREGENGVTTKTTKGMRSSSGEMPEDERKVRKKNTKQNTNRGFLKNTFGTYRKRRPGEAAARNRKEVPPSSLAQKEKRKQRTKNLAA